MEEIEQIHRLLEAADEIERLRIAIVDYVMTISDCYATPATVSDALEPTQ